MRGATSGELMAETPDRVATPPKRRFVAASGRGECSTSRQARGCLQSRGRRTSPRLPGRLTPAGRCCGRRSRSCSGACTRRRFSSIPLRPRPSGRWIRGLNTRFYGLYTTAVGAGAFADKDRSDGCLERSVPSEAGGWVPPASAVDVPGSAYPRDRHLVHVVVVQ